MKFSKIFLGFLILCLFFIVRISYAASPSINVGTPVTASTTAQIPITESGTSATSYDFYLNYAPSVETQSLTTWTTPCSFDATDQTFDSTNTTSCTFSLTGLTPNIQYYYTVSSQPAFAGTSNSPEGNFTTTPSVQPNPTGSTAFSLDASGQTYDSASQSYTENFSITPSAPITTAEQVNLELYGTGTVPVQTIPVPIPTGSGATSIIVENLAAQTYTAQLTTSTDGAPAVLSSLIQFSITPNSPSNTTDTCGSANTQSYATIPSDYGTLCGSGTLGPISSTLNGWSWTCGTAPCSAVSTANPSPGTNTGDESLCGNDNSGVVTGTPASTDLCGSGATGSGLALSSDGGSWSWTCTASSGMYSNCGASASSSGSTTPTTTSTTLLNNPISYNTIPQIIAAVINNIVLPVAVPFLGIMLMYSGFLYVVARRENKVYNIEKAKSVLKYTLIGAVIMLGAFVIANALQGTVNALTNTTSMIVEQRDITNV